MLRKVLQRVARSILARTKDRTPENRSEALRAWLKDEGDRKLRNNYQLKDTSIVFDLGGYEGQWTRLLYCQI